MAKFIRTYQIHLGDHVSFRPFASKDELFGIVQDISELPDIWVEVGNPQSEDYNRYRISVNMIKDVYCQDEPWDGGEVVFEKDEPLDFVYEDDLITKKIVRKYKD